MSHLSYPLFDPHFAKTLSAEKLHTSFEWCFSVDGTPFPCERACIGAATRHFCHPVGNPFGYLFYPTPLHKQAVKTA
jgi:hypothetical protein